MNAKFLFGLTKVLNNMTLSIQDRNKLIDLMSVIEVKAKLEILRSLQSDLEVKIETWEEYLEELEQDAVDKGWEEYEKMCPRCESGPMKSIIDNVGFTEPDGPSKNEVIGSQCTACGHTE